MNGLIEQAITRLSPGALLVLAEILREVDEQITAAGVATEVTELVQVMRYLVAHAMSARVAATTN